MPDRFRDHLICIGAVFMGTAIGWAMNGRINEYGLWPATCIAALLVALREGVAFAARRSRRRRA